MVVDGQVEVRPMMYLALSYDHRAQNSGAEAVSFLVRIKDLVEDPESLLLEGPNATGPTTEGPIEYRRSLRFSWGYRGRPELNS